MFDISLERIIRLNERGRGDGQAVPVSNSPGSRDGALTTFQHFDEPHRLFMPRHIAAHETMAANLTKRSEEHKSELQSPMRISYAVFCLKKNKQTQQLKKQ